MESGDGVCTGSGSRSCLCRGEEKAKDAVHGSEEVDEDSGIRLSKYGTGQSGEEQQRDLLYERKL